MKIQGKTLDNWLCFYLSEGCVLAEVAGCKCYFALTLIWQNRHFQVWIQMFIKYSSLDFSEFILAVDRFLKPVFKEILNNLYVFKATTYVE